MQVILLLIISILPIILIGYYLYKKDKNKEPKGLLFLLFFGGILSCVYVIFISVFLNFIPVFQMDFNKLNFIEKIINIFIGISLVEELSKWLILYLISYNHKEFDELYDMIIYATFVSLGFACFENILYVLEGGFTVGILRAVLAVPGHVWDAVFMGEYLGIAKICRLNGRKDLEKKNILLSIIIPFVLHGIYDFCLELENYLAITLFFVFVVIMYIISIKKIKKIALVDSKILKKIHYCSNCGNEVNGNYCSNCGNKILKNSNN